MIAIVTSRTFILCESINNMYIEPDFEGYGRAMIPYYRIVIDFESGNRSNNQASGQLSSSRNSDTRSIVNIKIIGEDAALRLFKELVQQVREQCPDQVYLDKMMEKILSGQLGDVRDDTEPVKASPTRKKKRAGKKVLRRAK